MSLKKKIRKMTAILLAVGMLTSLLPQNFAFAAETASETASESDAEKDAPEEQSSEAAVTENTTSAENPEALSVDENGFIVFDHYYSDVNTDDIKTSELFVVTNDSNVFTSNTKVESNYDNAYIISFDSVEEAKYAYSYYIDKVDSVCDMSDVVTLSDESISDESISDDITSDSKEEEKSDDEENDSQPNTEAVERKEEDVADLSDINEGDDSLSKLNDIDAESYKGYIALIDSGSDDAEVKMSVISDDTSDNVGHGNKMYRCIKEENPNAKVLSIKAFDDKKTNVADVYAAIKLAIESKVSIINMSFVASDIEKNSVVKEVIQEAIENDITIIGAAGNYSSSAKKYIPGCINDVITVGAVNEDGTLYKTSNYDADLYVIAESTSEATARYSGIYSSNTDSNKVFYELNSGTYNDNEGETVEDFTLQAGAQSNKYGNAPNNSDLPEQINCRVNVVGKGTYPGQFPGEDGVSFYVSSIDSERVSGTKTTGETDGLYLAKDYPSDHVFVTADDINNNGLWNNYYTHGYIAPGTQTGSGQWKTYVNNCWLNETLWWGGTPAGSSSTGLYFGTGYNSTNYGVTCCEHDVSAMNFNSYSIQASFVKVWDEANNGKYTAIYVGTFDCTTDGTPTQKLAVGFAVQKTIPWKRYYKIKKVDKKKFESVIGCDIAVYASDNATKIGDMKDNNDGTYTWESEYMTEDKFQQIILWEVKGGTGSSTGATYNNSDNNNHYISSSGALSSNMELLSSHYVYQNEETSDPYPTDIEVTQTKKFYVSVKKVDGSNNNNLANCNFQIYAQKGTDKRVIKNGTSRSDGMVYYDDNLCYVDVTSYYYEQGYDIYAVETGAPTGYEVNTVPKKITPVNTDNPATVLKNTPSITAKNYKTEVKILKSSADTTYTNGNPNYSLAGTKFSVYKNAACTDYVGEITINADGTSSTLNVGSKMNKDASGNQVNTTMYYKETAAGKGYELDTRVYSKTIVAGQTTTINASNKPLNDPMTIEIEKKGGNNPNGTLEGAQFTVKFYPQDVTQPFDDTKAASQTWVFESKKENDKVIIRFEKGYCVSGSAYFDATTNRLNLPYGYVTVQETTPPTGYKLDGDFTFTTTDGTTEKADANGRMVLKIAQNGILTPSGKVANAAVKKEEEIRADVIIKKVDHNGDPISGVKFEIEEDTTKEKVIVVTDDDGIFCSASSYVPHSTNTNAGVAKCGTWFGDMTDIKDDLGALYYGNYTIRELRCDANKGMQLEKALHVTVDETVDSQVIPVFDANATDAQTFVWNMPVPEIHTDAKVVETDSKMVGQPGAEAPDDDTISDTHTYPATFDYTDQTITDDMFYSRLRANTSYVTLAELMVIDNETKTVEPYMEDDGSGNMVPYKRIQAFKTDADYEHSVYEKEGHVEVTLDHIDPTDLTNKKFVVYETVYLNETGAIQSVADIPADDQAEQYDGYETLADAEMDFFPIRHNDPDDVLQQLSIGTAHTTTIGAEQDHIGIVGDNKFVDRVFYQDLLVSETYTLEGRIHLIDEQGNDTILTDKDGNEIVATKTFTATQTEGYEDIEFVLDDISVLMGERIICEDGIRQGKRRIIFHCDLEDEDEFYYIPKIKTSTRNTKVDTTKVTDENKDSSKEVKAAEGESFTDTISYQALIANRTWRVRGVLMDKATGQVMVDATGKEIKATTTFETKNVDAVPITTYPYRSDYEMADGTVLDLSADHADYLANGTIDLEFKGYDFTNLANKTGVVFEEVYLVTTDKDGNEKESLVAEHKDIQDIDQFTYFIECKTKAQDTTTKTRVVPLNQKTIVQDTIIYKNTIPGKTYKATSKFVVKNDKSGKYKDGDTLLGADGKPVTATVTFTPDKPDGEVVVDIPLDTTNNLVDMELVVFEDITNTLGLEVATHADINDDYQTIEVPGGETTATDNATGDHVSSNQKTITITDVITFRNLEPGKEYTAQGQLYYKNGKPVEADGKPVINTVKFTPKEKNGTVDVPFMINAELLAGQTIIAFEDISVNKIPVFMHHDLNDESQSVHIPEIGTTATFKDGSKSQTASKKVTIVDKCVFKNLIVGQSYTIKGVLYNKSTGEKLVVDGKNVTAEKTFTAETTEGTVELEFTFDASSLSGDVVAYEYAYHNDIEVATHTDINDQGQTVTLVPPSKTPPKTGMIVFFIILGIMAAGGAGMLIFKRKKA